MTRWLRHSGSNTRVAAGPNRGMRGSPYLQSHSGA